MKNVFSNTIVSRWLIALTIAAMVYSIQIYPFYHLHHFHQDGALEFEMSSHPNGVDVAHVSDHRHDHDTDEPHSSDHQSHFDKHFDLPILRLQTPRSPTVVGQYLRPSILGVLADDGGASCADNEAPLFIDRYQVWSAMFRGPPVLG